MTIAFEASKTLLPAVAMFLLSLSLLVWWQDDVVALDRIPSRTQQPVAGGSALMDFPIERDDVVRRGPAYRAASLAPAHAQSSHGHYEHTVSAHEFAAPESVGHESVVHESVVHEPVPYGEQIEAQHINGELYAEEIRKTFPAAVQTGFAEDQWRQEDQIPQDQMAYEEAERDPSIQEDLRAEDSVLQLEVAEGVMESGGNVSDNAADTLAEGEEAERRHPG